MAKHGRELFSARIEAWAHGPVVVEVFPKFTDYGNQPIAAHEGCDSASLSSEDQALAESIWETYGRNAGWALREMTHDEAPWKDSRRDFPDGAASKVPISQDSLRTFFKAEQERRLRKMGVDPVGLARSMKQARRGEVTMLDLGPRTSRLGRG